MKAGSGRNTVLFLAMAGLAFLVLLGPFQAQTTNECIEKAVLLSAAGFLAGWLSHCRRPAGGGWVAGGAVAVVLVLGLAAPVAVELERREVERGWLSEAEALGATGGTDRAFRSVDRSIHESRELERRAEAAWDRLFPLGLALAPAAFLGSVGALLADNRRRKRRPAMESEDPEGSEGSEEAEESGESGESDDAESGRDAAEEDRAEIPSRAS